MFSIRVIVALGVLTDDIEDYCVLNQNFNISPIDLDDETLETLAAGMLFRSSWCPGTSHAVYIRAHGSQWQLWGDVSPDDQEWPPLDINLAALRLGLVE